MDPIKTVHECLFCSQTFDSAIEKDDHTLEHFAQETCTECNRNLIRIGSNLYTKHTTETCIKHTIQHHHSSIGIEVNDVKGECYIDKMQERTVNNDLSNGENSYTENEIEQNNICQDPIKSECNQIKAEEEVTEADDDSTQVFAHDDESQMDHLSAEYNSTESHSQNEPASDAMKNGKIECDICGKIMFASSLVRHKGRFHNFCPVCTRIFPDNMDFIQHKRQCIAEKITDEAAETVAKPTHDCSICKSKLKTRASYRSHMRMVHGPEVNESYECSRCRTQFKLKRSLQRHVCRIDKGQLPLVYINPKKHIIDGRYVCDICNTSYANRKQLRHHKIVVHKELGANPCKICAKVFPTEDELTLHQIECRLKNNKRKLDEKPFQCDICKMTLKGKRGIRLHMEKVHIKTTKRFKCDQCEWKFRQKSELTAHNKLVHLKLRDFICTVCGEAFQIKFQLNDHMHKHSGEKFKCPHENCEKYFDTPSKLKGHIQTHQVRTHELLKCDLCGLSYKGKDSLRSHHKFVHLNIRNHKCMICSEVFTTKYALKKHMYIHTGEKPFSCTHPGCERKFRCKTNLQEHNRMHTGEKPFLCDIDGCQQRFRYSVDFRRHKLKIHGISSKKRN